MSSSTRRLKIIPLVVACPIFLQNLDTSVMTTALPAIAHSLNVQVLDLNLAITSYLLSLAVFLPASAWLSDRFGAKRIFCAAVLIFAAGSALCGLAQSLGQLVVFRILQGIGGSMMVPVGRTILLRSVPPNELVRAMIWFTVPGAFGRLAGPLLGGAVVTFVSWRWIFLINIPFGVIGVALAMWLVEPDPDASGTPAQPFDIFGLGLLALSLAGLLGGLEMMGKSLLPGPLIAVMVAVGCVALYAYMRRSRLIEQPILDFGVLRYPAYRMTILGAFPIRVAIGAAPFLLPLMLQIGFGLSPLNSGLLTMAMAVGSLSTRGAMTYLIRRIGVRRLMIAASLTGAAFYASYSLFTPHTPQPLMFTFFLLCGICTSIVMVTINAVGYADIPKLQTSHAAALGAMTQQLSLALGVVIGASVVTFFSYVHGGGPHHLQAADFPPAFLVVAALTAMSGFAFRRLRPEVGAELGSGKPGGGH